MAAQPLTHIGHTIAFRSGAVTIALSWVREGVYRVGIHTGSPVGMLGRELDGVSYGDQDVARGEARRMVKAYWGGETTEQLADRYMNLLEQAETWRTRRGPYAAGLTAKLMAQADAIQPLQGRGDDRALVAQLLADFATTDVDANYRAAVAAA